MGRHQNTRLRYSRTRRRARGLWAPGFFHLGSCRTGRSAMAG